MFTDGLWHSVSVDIESGGNDRIGKISITIDGRADTSNRQLSFTTSEYYYIGGLYFQQESLPVGGMAPGGPQLWKSTGGGIGVLNSEQVCTVEVGRER